MSDVDVVFFSQGCGRGHAIPDLAVLRDLKHLCPDVRVLFVSYAVGAEVFRAAGETVVDLDLPEMNPFFETLVRAAHVLQRTAARLVVSHEEPAVLPAAKICHLPSAFMAHWFPSPPDPSVQALGCADRVWFMERAGLFPEPREVAGRVDYVAPVLRHLTCGREDGDVIRGELNVDLDETVILVLPGSPDESVTPTSDLILHAFDLLSCQRKRLIWVSSKDYTALQERVRGREDIRVVATEWRLDRLMVACDLAITKGTYNIGRELAALGVPSISLSHGHNPIDDLYARNLRNNAFLWVKETTAASLAHKIESKLKEPLPTPDTEVSGGQGREQVAVCLCDWLQVLRRGSPPVSTA
jgi:hypothetical protein